MDGAVEGVTRRRHGISVPRLLRSCLWRRSAAAELRFTCHVRKQATLSLEAVTGHFKICDDGTSRRLGVSLSQMDGSRRAKIPIYRVPDLDVRKRSSYLQHNARSTAFARHEFYDETVIVLLSHIGDSIGT